MYVILSRSDCFFTDNHFQITISRILSRQITSHSEASKFTSNAVNYVSFCRFVDMRHHIICYLMLSSEIFQAYRGVKFKVRQMGLLATQYNY